MNVAKISEKYIESHPSIKDCVEKDLINYSQLSRRIIKETPLKNKDFDAVLIAARRYFEKISKQSSREDKIIYILKNSDVEVKNKISVVVIDKTSFTDDLIALEKLARKQRVVYYAIEGTEVITLVISSKLLPEVKKRFPRTVLNITNELVLVLIHSPEEIKETIGTFAHLSTLLSHNNINIFETLSCWNETIFVVSEKDIAGVMKALSF
ncbi:MAG TPA: hypothetical protein VJB90_05335 [Candidatus Nanoarchaeia archaeon]|nr:hypothetical protein [Candidatus Nanoarchaeia archaeon]